MEYYKKMSIVMTRAGILMQCLHCGLPDLTPEEADLHTQAECEERVNLMIDDVIAKSS